MIKISKMPTEVKKQIKVFSNDGNKGVTFFITGDNNVLVQEEDGIEMTDFWTEVSWEDWQKVTSFLTHQRQNQ